MEWSKKTTDAAQLWAKLTPVGVKTLTEFSVLRNNVELTQYLSPAPAVVNVHTKYRLRYTSP